MGSDAFFTALSDLAEHLRGCRALCSSEEFDSDLAYRVRHVVDSALRFERALRDEDQSSELANLIRANAMALSDALRRVELASKLTIAECAIANKLQSKFMDLARSCRAAVGQHNERFLPWFEAAMDPNGL